ncbi:MAG: hypothetical protein NVSMB23_22860 [Myxococcales bacterium]
MPVASVQAMETRFRYKSAAALVAWMCADLFVITIGVSSALRGDVAGVGFSVIAFLLFAILGLFLVLSQSDVVVSETGLSRQQWGKTLKEMSWDNVKKIQVFTTYHKGLGRTIRVFHVFPVRPSGPSVMPSGKIWFGEHGDFSAVIEHMNRFIAANGIPVEVKIGGNWAARSGIDPIP